MMLWLARATVITIPSVQRSMRDCARVMSYQTFLETSYIHHHGYLQLPLFINRPQVLR